MRAGRLIGAWLLATALVSAGAAEANDYALVARGEYLARAADCAACHTVPGGREYAGGRAIRTIFSTIYAPNITPDVATGIGSWSDSDFLRAMHQGLGKRGEQLYPVFPYTEFTRLSDADALAIKAYLFSQPAVAAIAPANHLHFPFNLRPLLAVWKLLNFTRGRFAADPNRGAAYDRGEYLATALGHCAECHTPRTLTQGLDRTRPLAGAPVEGWDAFNITPDPKSGIGDWSVADIATYLQTGRLGNRAQAAGPMAEVIADSTHYLTPQDAGAIATYLTAQPAIHTSGDAKPRDSYGQPDPDLLSFSAPEAPAGGRTLYVAACAACHGLNGAGQQGGRGGAPSLIGNSTLGAADANNLALSIVHGIAGGPAGYMPPFGPASTVSDALSDAQIASLTQYLMRQFGNPNARALTGKEVKRLRRIQSN